MSVLGGVFARAKAEMDGDQMSNRANAVSINRRLVNKKHCEINKLRHVLVWETLVVVSVCVKGAGITELRTISLACYNGV